MESSVPKTGVYLRATTGEECQVRLVQPGALVATLGCYLIKIIRTRGDLEFMAASRAVLTGMGGKRRSVGYVLVLEAGADTTFPSDMRAAMHAFVKDFTDNFSAAAIVYEATGFGATITRSLVTAVNIASGARHPNKVFKSCEEAVEWVVAATPNSGVRASTLKSTVDKLRLSWGETQSVKIA